jgi:F-box and leucine-rich repeat protein GRR1
LFCCNITDTSVIEIAKGCPQLTSINLSRLLFITDASIIELAKECSQLASIDLHDCWNITDASLNALSETNTVVIM